GAVFATLTVKMTMNGMAHAQDGDAFTKIAKGATSKSKASQRDAVTRTLTPVAAGREERESSPMNRFSRANTHPWRCSCGKPCLLWSCRGRCHPVGRHVAPDPSRNSLQNSTENLASLQCEPPFRVVGQLRDPCR